MNASELRHAWVSMFQPYPWQVFLTLTFDRKRIAPSYSVLPHSADKAFRGLVLFFNQRLYGPRYRRKTKHKGVVWVRVAEAHRDGVLHFHAVLHAPSGPMPEDLIRAAEEGLRFEMQYIGSDPLEEAEITVVDIAPHDRAGDAAQRRETRPLAHHLRSAQQRALGANRRQRHQR